MTKIVVFMRDGGLSYLRPAPGARLARSITLADGRKIEAETPQPVDAFLRAWPIAGATVEWAESEEEFVARIAAKDVPPDATGVRIVDDSELPQDRTFRGGWTLRDGRVAHDMERCREIWREKLRAERAPKLAALDVEFMRADERGDAAKKTEIAARKQALRDAPNDPRIEAAKTPEELKQIELPE